MPRQNILHQPWIHAYLDRPRVKPVALFTTLNVSFLLLRSLFDYSPFSAGPPLFSATETLIRLSVAAGWLALSLWIIRPDQRRWWEWLLFGLSVLTFGTLAFASAQPTALLLLLPLIIRFWQPFKRTLILFVILLPISIYFHHKTGSAAAEGFGTNWVQIFTLLVFIFAPSASAYAAFELMLRNEQKQRALETTLVELRGYRGLELQHAALQERAHLSRELHDTLGHHLTVLRLEAQRARKLTQRSNLDDPDITRALTQVVERSGQSLQQLQEIVSTLKTPQLNGTLYQALDDLVEHWPGEAELWIEGDEPDLPSAHCLSLYRSLQEALTNAHKYAHGQSVHAHLRQTGDCLELNIRNARGSPYLTSESSPPPVGGGHGLTGLRSRLETLGGQLRIIQDEEVFELCLTLPIPR